MNECDGIPIKFIYKSRQWAGFGCTVIVSWSLFQRMIFPILACIYLGEVHVSRWASLENCLRCLNSLSIWESLQGLDSAQCGQYQVVRDACDFSFPAKWISERDKREKALMIILSIGYFMILKLICVFLTFSNSASIVLIFLTPYSQGKDPEFYIFLNDPFLCEHLVYFERLM